MRSFVTCGLGPEGSGLDTPVSDLETYRFVPFIDKAIGGGDGEKARGSSDFLTPPVVSLPTSAVPLETTRWTSFQGGFRFFRSRLASRTPLCR
jgi:hypothetical protein